MARIREPHGDLYIEASQFPPETRRREGERKRKTHTKKKKVTKF